MSVHSDLPRITLHELRKLSGERKLSVLTCYDASFAQVMDRASVDMLLIGDSLGMVVQGQDSTLPVTMDETIYHTRAVVRGAARAWIIADMPFGSYQLSPAQACENAVRLMQAGAQMVKLEGDVEMVDTVAFLTARGIPVCAHIGLTPQHVHALGGYRIQGKAEQRAQQLRDGAKQLRDAGAAMMVLEAMPEPLARAIADDLRGDVITIGIGASVACDAQVLVMHDMLGVADGKRPRFVKNFLTDHGSIEAAVRAYVADVQAGRFPGAEHVYADSK